MVPIIGSIVAEFAASLDDDRSDALSKRMEIEVGDLFRLPTMDSYLVAGEIIIKKLGLSPPAPPRPGHGAAPTAKARGANAPIVSSVHYYWWSCSTFEWEKVTV
jgi:hypothetical protein